MIWWLIWSRRWFNGLYRLAGVFSPPGQAAGVETYGFAPAVLTTAWKKVTYFAYFKSVILCISVQGLRYGFPNTGQPPAYFQPKME